MTNIVQDVAAVASVATKAGSAASVVSDVASVAEKAVSTVAGGVVTGFLPYILGIFGAVILGLAATVFWQSYITIPALRAQDAIDRGATAQANAATAECNASQEALRTKVDDQNAKIDGLKATADAADQRAAAAGAAAIWKPLPAPPADKSAAAVNAYLHSLRTSP